MAEGRGRFEWDQTSVVLAMLNNTHASKKEQMRQPRDFHPFEAGKPRRKKPAIQMSLRDLAPILKGATS